MPVAGICGGSRRPFRAPRSGTSASPGVGSAGCSGDAVVLHHRGTAAPIWDVGSTQFPEGPIFWGGGDPPPASRGGQDYSRRCKPGVPGCPGWELQRSGRGCRNCAHSRSGIALLCHSSGVRSLSWTGSPGFAPGVIVLGPAGAMGSTQSPEEPFARSLLFGVR